jgi:hypothetical protein
MVALMAAKVRPPGRHLFGVSGHSAKMAGTGKAGR